MDLYWEVALPHVTFNNKVQNQVLSSKLSNWKLKRVVVEVGLLKLEKIVVEQKSTDRHTKSRNL